MGPSDAEVADLVARLGGTDSKDVNDAARRLVEIGAPAVDALELPRTAPYVHRAAAIEVLGWMGPAADAAVPWLVETLRTDATARNVASRALGKIGSAAVPPLIALLGPGTDAEIRGLACETLGYTRLRREDVRRALLDRHRDDPVRSVRDDAASALGRISFRDAETLGALERTADTSELNAQFYATYALAHMGPEGGEVLLRLARSPHEGARASAVGSLGDAKEAPAEPRVDALLAAVSDPSRWVRGNAASSLGDIGRPALRALPQLRQLALTLASDGDDVAASKARDAIHRLETVDSPVPAEVEDGIERPPDETTPPPR
jgi:HEAT repeat protein